MKRIIFTFVLICIWSWGQCCSCDYGGNFLKVAKHAKSVVLIKVKGYADYFKLEGAGPNSIDQPMSITVEVIEVLSGNEERKEIKIFGDDGVLCRPYIDNFKLGEYYVVVLFKCKDFVRSNGVRETSLDYFASVCGEYWVSYHANTKTVQGRIKPARKRSKTYPMEKLRMLIKDTISTQRTTNV